MSLTVMSAAVCRICDSRLIFVPFGHYDEPEVLSYAIPLIYPINADVRQQTAAEIHEFFQELVEPPAAELAELDKDVQKPPSPLL